MEDMGLAITEFSDARKLQLTDADLMCIYREHSTGLKGCIVYCSPRNASHSARVKVLEGTKVRGMDYDASIGVSDLEWKEGRSNLSKEVRERCEAWVLANQHTLLQFWNGGIEDDCVELAQRFVKI